MTSIEQAERHYLAAIKAIHMLSEGVKTMTASELEKCRYSFTSIEANAHWAQRDLEARLAELESFIEAAE